MKQGLLRSIAVTVVLGTMTPAVMMATGPTAFATTLSASDQTTLNTLVSELQKIDGALTAQQKTDVYTAANDVRNLKTPTWDAILYGTTSGLTTAQDNAVTAIEAIVKLTYTSATQSTNTDLDTIVTELNSAAPAGTTITADDVVQFYSKFRSEINLPNLLSATSVTSLLSTALEDAAAGTVFKGYLSNLGLSATDIPTIWNALVTQVPLLTTAENDLIQAAVAAQAPTGGGAGGGGGGGGGVGTTGSTSTTPPTPSTPALGSGKAFGTVVSKTTVSAKTGAKIAAKVGTSDVSLDIPAGAFAADEDVSVTTGDPTTLEAPVPKGSTAVYSIGISFSGAAPTVPVTLTISDPSIPANAKLYKLSSTGDLIPVDATVTAGNIVFSFTADPDFVVVVPKAVKTSPKNIVVNGQAPVVAPGVVKNNTTYVPIWYVMHALKSAGVNSAWNGTQWKLTAPSNVAVDLSKISAGQGTMGIFLDGKLVQHVTGFAQVDPNSNQETTYMPIWFVMKALDRAKFTSKWNGTTWNLTVPKQAQVTPLLNVGSKGSAVVTLQKDLGIKADGVFGAQTLLAVEKFQKANGLSADGIVGASTWAALQRK